MSQQISPSDDDSDEDEAAREETKQEFRAANKIMLGLDADEMDNVEEFIDGIIDTYRENHDGIDTDDSNDD